MIKRTGGPEVLEHVKDFLFPAASESEILIHTVSTCVNPVDTYVRNGLFGIKLAESQQLVRRNIFRFSTKVLVAHSLESIPDPPGRH